MNAAAPSQQSLPQKYPPTFYISSRSLPNHVNRTVRIIGRVVSVSADGKRVQLESCDGGNITIQRSGTEAPFTSKFVCVTGKVQSDLTVNESISESFGDNFSRQIYGKDATFIFSSLKIALNKCSEWETTTYRRLVYLQLPPLLNLPQMGFTICFYFDFLSPYSYLAFHLLRRHFLPAWRKLIPDIKVEFKPVSLPHIIARSGNSPPGNVPARRAYLLKDLERGARFYQVEPFTMPEKFPFDTRKMLMAAIESEDIEAFVAEWWGKVFAEGKIDFIERDLQVMRPDESRAILMLNTAEALELGAFGVPFWAIQADNEPTRREVFFGSDRFHYMAACMAISPGNNKL